MEVVDQELCVFEEHGLPGHAVQCESAREIIAHVARHLFPPREEQQKGVVAPLTFWDTVEPHTDHMWAPGHHYASCKPATAVGFIVLVAEDGGT